MIRSTDMDTLNQILGKAQQRELGGLYCFNDVDMTYRPNQDTEKQGVAIGACLLYWHGRDMPVRSRIELGSDATVNMLITMVPLLLVGLILFSWKSQLAE